MKYKLLLLLISAIIGFYVGFKLADRTLTVDTTKPVKTQTLNTKVSVSNPTIAKVEVKKVEVVKINNRGDKAIKPIEGVVTTDRGETDFTIEIPTLIKNDLSKFKIGLYAFYQDSKVQPSVGFLYELLNYSNYNFNAGFGLSGVLLNIGYSFTQTLDGFLGVSITDRHPSAVFGVGVRF